MCTAQNDGSKQGMGEVQSLGLRVLNFLEILVWAEHSLEGLDSSPSTGGGKCRQWKDIQGCSQGADGAFGSSANSP